MTLLQVKIVTSRHKNIIFQYSRTPHEAKKLKAKWIKLLGKTEGRKEYGLSMHIYTNKCKKMMLAWFKHDA